MTKIIQLQTPLQPIPLKKLKKGTIAEISGTLYTARDAVHKYLAEGHQLPFSLKGQIIYHCGPIMVRENGKWICHAAGPTTAMREEPYLHKIIPRFRPAAIISKGKIGEKSQKTCQKYHCVYFNTIGGAAQVLANCIKKVKNVYFLEK